MGALIRTLIKAALRALCCCCSNCVYNFICNCFEVIIARFNEYVLCEVGLLNVEFYEGSKRLVNIFSQTGMTFITNEVAWAVPITVGTILGACFCGGVGLLIHKIM